MKMISQEQANNLSKHATGGVITIYVGPKRKEYQVYKSLLAPYEYWRKRLDSKLNQDSQAIYLPGYDPDIWDVFVNWLYRGSLKDICSENEDMARIQLRQYIMLYTGAERWAIPALQNKIMDRLRAWTSLWSHSYPCEMIRRIYRCAPKDSPLRSGVVDSFLLESSLWNADGDKGGRAARLKSQLKYGNQEFVLECFEALAQLNPKSKLRALERRTGCICHEHEEREKSQLMRPKLESNSAGTKGVRSLQALPSGRKGLHGDVGDGKAGSNNTKVECDGSNL